MRTVIARLGPLLALLALASGSITWPAGAQSPEATPPVPTPSAPSPAELRTPPPSIEPPPIRAASALLMDLDTGQVLFSLAPGERRPIASLTKIMTAYLVMRRTDPTDVVTVSADAASGDRPGVSNLGLEAGEEITVHELLYALLLASANDAAVALAEHVAGTVEGFVRLMNRTARRLDLSRTEFASPSGLDDRGYSTARDLARLTRVAYRIPGFSGLVATRFHLIPSPDGAPRGVQNRNVLVWLYPGTIGVKTGFTTAAGFCLVAAADRGDLRLLTVILGEPGEPFSDAAALLDHGFTAFERRMLIEEGEPLGTVLIDGRRIDVAAGATLEALVPVNEPIDRSIAVDAEARFPPPDGDVIGEVVVSVPGRTLGIVPLMVTDVPGPPPVAEPGPWWRRAAAAVVDAGVALVRALFSA